MVQKTHLGIVAVTTIIAVDVLVYQQLTTNKKTINCPPPTRVVNKVAELDTVLSEKTFELAGNQQTTSLPTCP